MEHTCQEGRRFEAMEREIAEIKQMAKENATEITMLRESQTEMKVYIKQIFERLDDIKFMFSTSYTNIANLVNTGKDTSGMMKDMNQSWVKVVVEIIKLVALVAGIIAGIKFGVGGIK